MLRDEHGVPAHRRLLAVIGRVRRRQSPVDEVTAVPENRLHAPRLQISPLGLTQAKTAAEA